MTNTSHLSMSNISPPTLLKYKIVLVGDQAVGKSSIINRFIYDIFDVQDHVSNSLCRDQPSALISFPTTSSLRKKPFDCSFGIPQDNKDFDLWFRTTLGIAQSPLLFMILLIETRLKVSKDGLKI